MIKIEGGGVQKEKPSHRIRTFRACSTLKASLSLVTSPVSRYTSESPLNNRKTTHKARPACLLLRQQLSPVRPWGSTTHVSCYI